MYFCISFMVVFQNFICNFFNVANFCFGVVLQLESVLHHFINILFVLPANVVSDLI